MPRARADAPFHPDELPAGRVPVLFTADWCGYCRQFGPHFRRVAGGRVVDVSDDDDPLWDDLGLRVVPTVLLFEDGKAIRRWEGVLGGAHVEEIERALGG